MRRKSSGVTLIELMIVIVIVAILASIAVPSYREYVLRGHRVQAKSALLRLAAAQEQYYVQNNTYADNAKLSTAPPGGLGITATTENGFYDIAISASSATAWTATATAKGTQLAGDTRCKVFQLTSTGVKSAKNSADAANDTECWGK